MIQYNQLGFYTRFFPSLNLSFYAREFKAGDIQPMPSPVSVEGICPTAPLLTKGKIQVTNGSYPDMEHIIEGGPGKIFPDTILPGMYVISCQEDDTEYVCVMMYDFTLNQIQNAMKHDWPQYIETTSLLVDNVSGMTITEGGHTNCVICLYGSITLSSSLSDVSVVLTASDVYPLADGEVVTIHRDPNSLSWAEVAWPKTKPPVE